MASVTICSDFGAQENKVSHYLHGFPTYCELAQLCLQIFFSFYLEFHVIHLQ